MRFAILASGSKGNAALVEYQNHLFLIDCGISFRRLCLAMESLGTSAADITDVLISHEHSDHINGLKTLVKQTGLLPYMTRGTAYKLKLSKDDYLEIAADINIDFANLQIIPYTIPHDAQEAVHFQFIVNECKLSFITDVGRPNEYIKRQVNNSNAFVIESNYDVDMLENNPKYPPSLKERIQSGHGHLSNDQAGELLRATIGPQSQLVVAAHLSENNNNPTVCTETLKRWINKCNYSPQLAVAHQNQATTWFEVT